MATKVVLLGDSMVDTYDFMGSGFPELKRELVKLDPSSYIELKNHGVGTTDVALGLQRTSVSYDYLARGRKLPAVIDESPDLVILESFAYNHWTDSPDDINKYVACHRNIIRTIKEKTSAKILLLSTIAPNKKKFATGVLSLNWTEQKRVKEYELVIKYFCEFNQFASQSGLPFLNLFDQSLTSQTGKLAYISNVDYVHLSYSGRTFISRLLAPEILKLIQ